MQRYFVEKIEENRVYLSRDDQHHLIKVMRKREKDEIISIFEGKSFKCSIHSIHPLVINVVSEILDNKELDNDITLFMSLIRKERFELVLEKATELGVKNIYPIITRRTQYKIKDLEKIMKRWNRIVKEAGEQSERNLLPTIFNPIKIGDISKYAQGAKIFCYARNSNIQFSKNQLINQKDISLCVGPEGGFDETEVKLLEKYGFESVSLGKRILRAETAAIVGVSWIMKEVEL